MSEWTEEVRQMIVDCETRSASLSDWEVKFIDSISLTVGVGKSLTPRQYDTLEKIWEKVT
jgi:hypothetical protein